MRLGGWEGEDCLRRVGSCEPHCRLDSAGVELGLCGWVVEDGNWLRWLGRPGEVREGIRLDRRLELGG